MGFVTPPFPKRVEIVDGESFSSWVRRLAGAHRLRTIEMVADLGLRDAGSARPRTVLGFGDVLDRDVLERVAYRTRETPDRVLGTLTWAQIPGVRPLDVDDLPDEERIAAVAVDVGLNRRFSGVCAECVAETGAWQVSWQFAAHFACLIHRRMLRTSCPLCRIGYSTVADDRYQFKPNNATYGRPAPVDGCCVEHPMTPGRRLRPGSPELVAQAAVLDRWGDALGGDVDYLGDLTRLMAKVDADEPGDHPHPSGPEGVAWTLMRAGHRYRFGAPTTWRRRHAESRRYLIGARFTEAENTQVREAAAAAGLDTGDWVRRVVLDAVETPERDGAGGPVG